MLRPYKNRDSYPEITKEGSYQIRLVYPFFASADNLSLSPPLPLTFSPSPSLTNKGVIETDSVSHPIFQQPA